MTLTRMHQRKVFIMTYSFFRNKEDALDMVQEIFLCTDSTAGNPGTFPGIPGADRQSLPARALLHDGLPIGGRY